MEQTQSSAPWFCPPNTLCNTDGWRTRKSAGKITVRSAQKTGEAKKESLERSTKAQWGDLQRPRTPTPPDPGARGHTALSPLPGLSRLLAHLTSSPSPCDLLTFQSPR